MNPIGVLCLTIQSAHIVPWNRLRGGAPDPFVTVDINGAPELARTRYLSHEFEPTWMETKFIVIHSLAGTLNLRLYDHHEHRRHALLGVARFGLARLQEDSALGGHDLPLFKDDKKRGELLASVAYYPAISSLDNCSDCLHGSNLWAHGCLPATGIVTLRIWEARGLEPRDTAAGDFATAAQLRLGYNGAVIHATRHVVGTNPAWKATHAFYCPNRVECMIVVEVADDGGVMGELMLGLDDLLSGNGSGVEWWPLSGCASGAVKMDATWRNVETD